MINTYNYETDADIVKIIQITDPHLFKDKQGELLGINTQASFNQVLTEIQVSQYDYDFVLATGDLVQDSSDEGYQRFCQAVQPLQKWCFGSLVTTTSSRKWWKFCIPITVTLTLKNIF